MSRYVAPAIGTTLLALGVVAAIWGYPTDPMNVTGPSRFELHLASEEPQEGYHAATVQIGGRTVYVAPTAALTSAE